MCFEEDVHVVVLVSPFFEGDVVVGGVLFEVLFEFGGDFVCDDFCSVFCADYEVVVQFEH